MCAEFHVENKMSILNLEDSVREMLMQDDKQIKLIFLFFFFIKNNLFR